MTATFERAEVCVVACAEAFRGDGEILASGMGRIPALGARLARATFEPDLVLSDGEAALVVDGPGGNRVVEGYLPYRAVFDTLWNGRRHVMMGASQLDRYGNQNIACIGPHDRPKAQLLGARGAPGNTICHRTSYFVPNHSRRALVRQVDFVSGVGYDRAAALGPRAARFHDIHRVVTNLAVLDFGTPDRRMRLASVHPGVAVDEVVEQTGFDLVIPEQVPTTRAPTGEELALLREVLDPARAVLDEVPR
jgi:acyl CoA:acetate/3-ketoacid CoA transferase beta subunit